MKNFILKLIFIFNFVLIISFVFGQKSNQVSSIEELKRMASKYGLENTVSEHLNDNLKYVPKSEAEAYFKDQYEVHEGKKELLAYLSKTKNIRSPSDYYALLSSYPRVLKVYVNFVGGQLEFEMEKHEALTTKQRIYRNSAGVILLVSEKDPCKNLANFGERIDTLPRL